MTLDKMEGLVKRDLDVLDQTLKNLCAEAGLEVFNIEEDMWLRTTELSFLGLQLQPFDQAILGSVLVKADRLRKQGISRFVFCEADSDLQPWDRTGESKRPLVTLYDDMGIWVYGDFLMRSPAMPENWPKEVLTAASV